MSDLDLIALVDVESTGLSPTTDEVIELGCILFSLSHNCVLQQMSTLVPISHAGENLAKHINGITKASANRLATERALMKSFDFADEIVSLADAFLAHNAAFDKSFCEPTFEWGDLGKLWIDSRGITWPRATRQGCNLTELALCYGVPVWQNHRALTDCQLLAHIVQREPNAARLLAKELEPKVWATWRTTVGDKAGQAKAKAAGFRWNRPECPARQVWSRLMHADDIKTLPFEVVEMGVEDAA